VTHPLPLAEQALRQARVWPELLDLMLKRVREHGDAPRWEAALAALPELPPPLPRTQGVGTRDPEPPLAEAIRQRLHDALQGLHPWRKGPWWLHGVHIDTEWRSDWKWQRLHDHLPDLHGARVLDVGGGNGYYGWHMLSAGAREVVGIDPTILFLYQHLATHHILLPAYPQGTHVVLPLRLEDLPAPAPTVGRLAGTTAKRNDDAFDVVFSMGVLYHRRDPLEHLKELQAQLKPGGTLVLETLVCKTADLVPEGRYARMRNVHLIPTPATISGWLDTLGFTTPWMTFESLADALDPADPERTIEGHPAPARAIFVAH